MARPGIGQSGRSPGFREHVLKRDDLGHVSELFLTATTSELLPIVRVDDQRIGDGKPGPIVRRLQAA